MHVCYSQLIIDYSVLVLCSWTTTVYRNGGIKKWLLKFRWQGFSRLSYSPHLLPVDFNLFLNFNKNIPWYEFLTDNVIKITTWHWLYSLISGISFWQRKTKRHFILCFYFKKSFYFYIHRKTDVQSFLYPNYYYGLFDVIISLIFIFSNQLIV